MRAVSLLTRERMRHAALSRSPESEARRIASVRLSGGKISEAHKGKRPSNFQDIQKLAWEAIRKEVLSYSGIHAWVRRNWKSATHCDVCGSENLTGRNVHWANLDHKYSKAREDWKMMCRPCRAAHDRDHNGVDFSRKATRVEA